MAVIATQSIEIDLTPGGVSPFLYVSQGDYGTRSLTFNFYLNGQPYTIPTAVQTITLEGVTKAGHAFSSTCTFTSGGTSATSNLNADMTQTVGLDICQIVFKDASNNRLGTGNFFICVEKSPTSIKILYGSVYWSDLAKSWAVGGTGLRSGEDTNNSKYWCNRLVSRVDAMEPIVNEANNNIMSTNDRITALTTLMFQEKRPELIKNANNEYDIIFTPNGVGNTMFATYNNWTGSGALNTNTYYFRVDENGTDLGDGTYSFHLGMGEVLYFDASVVVPTAAAGANIVQLAVKHRTSLTPTDVVLAQCYPNDVVDKISGILPIRIRLAELEKNAALIEDINDIPSYSKSYMDERVYKINEIIAESGGNSDTFVFYTDTHFPSNNKNSGKYISYLLGKLPIRNAIFGGDICPAYSRYYDSDSKYATLQSIIDQNTYINKEVRKQGHIFQVKGNHDFHCSDGTSTATGDWYMMNPQQARNNVMGGSDLYNVVTNNDNPEASYYYVDYASQNIRYVIFDACEYFGENNLWVTTFGVSNDQLSWIITDAIMSAPNRNFIFVSHVPVIDVADGPANTHSYFTNVKSLIGAINKRSNITVGSNTFDFSTITGRVVLFLAGHTHKDFVTYSEGTLHASVTCDAIWEDYKNSYLYRHFNNIPPSRTAGTIYENTFDVVNVDCENNIVKFIRIGGGCDRYCHLSPIAINVGGTTTLTPSITGNTIEWWCYDADGRTVDSTNKIIIPNETRTSVSSGVVTGLTAGEAVVVAKNENDEYEFFNIVVN